jgi:hypothetical protein
VQPIPLVYPVQRVANTILGLVQNPRDESIVGTSGKVLEFQQKLSRSFTEKQAAKMTHKRQVEQAPPGRETSGSLFKPRKDDGEVSDQWTESGKYVDAGSLALAAALPIGIGLWLWRRAHRGQPEDVRAA